MEVVRKFRRPYKMFVRGLPWTVARDELHGYFKRFGEIKGAQVIFDKKTGFSKGYGFVEFHQQDDFAAALNLSEHILEGNRIYAQGAAQSRSSIEQTTNQVQETIVESNNTQEQNDNQSNNQ